WLETVNRMRALPGSGISEPDARTILIYLVKNLATDNAPPSTQRLGARAAAGGNPPAGTTAGIATAAPAGRLTPSSPTSRTSMRAAFPADRSSSPDPTTGIVVAAAVALSSLLFWRRGDRGRARQGDGASPDVGSPHHPVAPSLP